MGCRRFEPPDAARPPSVVSVPPSSIGDSKVQLLTASPLNRTTHVPHWLVSHPTWVPVRLSVSRSKSATSVAGSTSTVRDRPLSVKLIIMVTSGTFADIRQERGRGPPTKWQAAYRRYLTGPAERLAPEW